MINNDLSEPIITDLYNNDPSSAGMQIQFVAKIYQEIHIGTNKHE